MKTILALDPGETTGLVVLRWGLELPACVGPSEVLEHAQNAPEDTENMIERVLLDMKLDVSLLVAESYTFGPGSAKQSRQYESLYLIGVARYLSRRAGVEFKMQQPSAAKTAYTDKRLKELGWFDQVTGRHARDALRHALLSTH